MQILQNLYKKKSKAEVLLVPSILGEGPSAYVVFSAGCSRQPCYAKDLGLEFVKCWLQRQESVFGFCCAGIWNKLALKVESNVQRTQREAGKPEREGRVGPISDF